MFQYAQEKEVERLDEKPMKINMKIYGGCSVFIGNLPFSATEQEVGMLFLQAGNVVGVRIMYDRETNRPRGYGFCDFDSYMAAENACDMFNGYPFGGRILRVNLATKK
uniref:RRM domain-containing protein n=1 Tax=Acrobeloides nanus TaxID=290746 RepID=A0A914BZU0_9BILA